MPRSATPKSQPQDVGGQADLDFHGAHLRAEREAARVLGYDAAKIAQQFALIAAALVDAVVSAVDDTSAEDVFATRTQSLSISSDRSLKKNLDPSREADAKRFARGQLRRGGRRMLQERRAGRRSVAGVVWRSRIMGEDARVLRKPLKRPFLVSRPSSRTSSIN